MLSFNPHHRGLSIQTLAYNPDDRTHARVSIPIIGAYRFRQRQLHVIKPARSCFNPHHRGLSIQTQKLSMNTDALTVSIPIIGAYRFRLGSLAVHYLSAICFNPHHRGLSIQTIDACLRFCVHRRVSIPIIGAYRFRHGRPMPVTARYGMFQSPS